MQSHSASIADDEIAQFSHHAGDWWNPEGAFRPLHRLNPVRLRYICDQIAAHRGAGGTAHKQKLKGLHILDVGCGGGLLAEPLARLGAQVTGLDASEEAIKVARRHAEDMQLAVDYRAGSVEDLARGKTRYDVVTALEIIEHVADLDSFIKAVAGLVKPGGLVILSTLNRTPKSFALGIVAAEYLLNWAPRGTHQWRKFVRPSELVQRLDANGLCASDLTGVVYSPARGAFELCKDDVSVNYMMTATPS